MRNVVAVLVVCSLCLLPLLGGCIGQPVLGDQDRAPEGSGRVLLHYGSPEDCSRLQWEIIKMGGMVTASFEEIGFLSAFLPPNIYSRLADTGIAIYRDRPMHACLDTTVPLVKGTSWGTLETYFGMSINGSGIRVAILDTGIEVNHPDLDDLDDNGLTFDPKIVLQQSFVNGTASPDDDNGHGTHIAGIIGGTGAHSGGANRGVAPGCQILNGKVLDAAGQGEESWVVEGILWALANDADVINLSLGTNETGDGSDPLSQAIAYAVAQGVPVIMSAGIMGAGDYRISQPGVAAAGITVGSSDGMGLAPNSPSGPTLDWRLKPDLLAPGVDIDSCDDDASGYVRMSGTSQAAAFVTGAVALLRQVHPTWDPQDIKNALLTHAMDLGLNPYDQGAGRLYIPPAINTSLLITGVADYRLLDYGMNHLALSVRNLRPYPLTVSYGASAFTLNVSNPFTIPANGSMGVDLGYTPTKSAPDRVTGQIIFAVEGQTSRATAAGILPNLSLTIPPTIIYNSSLTARTDLTIDGVPIQYLDNATSYLVVTIGTGSTHQIPIRGDTAADYTFPRIDLPRGNYAVTCQLHAFEQDWTTVTLPLTVYGYPSHLNILNYTAHRWDALAPYLTDSTYIDGNVTLWIQQGGGWAYIGNLSDPETAMTLPTDLRPQTYILMLTYPGSPTTEPCATTFTLTILPNYRPFLLSVWFGFLGLGICGIGLVGVSTVTDFRRRRYSKQVQALRQKRAADAADHMARLMASQTAYFERVRTGLVDEPEKISRSR